MKAFMDKDFLLNSETAITLYHEYAAKMPIVDYHCHISPAEIAEDRQFENVAQAWLEGDHYKWRLMRACGVEEHYITGNATDYEKYKEFARIIPKAIGNPVYHWTHLELQRYFNCDIPLNEKTSDKIWNLCNAQLQTKELSVRSIIRNSNVTTIVTTDDPVDDLLNHKKLEDDPSFDVAVLPGWRPDKLLYIERDDFLSYVPKLAKAVGNAELNSMDSLQAALKKRMDFFHGMGCRASDHGVNDVVHAQACDSEVDSILRKRLSGAILTKDEENAFRWAMLVFLGEEYHKRGWVMEIHFGATRNNNTKAFKSLGADTGFDAINNGNSMPGLSTLLDTLEANGCLPRTMVFSLNPNDNAAIASTLGCFSEEGVPGKMQHGTAWWFNDNISGMLAQITNLANMSVLGNFTGMLTDSRSFLSYTRHEYFRRILCNLLGGWVENGEYPADIEYLGAMVQDISYNNAMKYFGFGE
ncbi:MAG TPA: glucuronate isomerase [Clostridiales bacterium]|nr:glucuronate isomerase [Clostridiales bacterium]